MFSPKGKTPPIEIIYQVLIDLVEMNLLVLKGGDPSHLETAIRAKLKGQLH